MPKSLISALRISLTYCIFAALWIVFSDMVLGWFIKDINLMNQAQTLKGWFFVLVTSTLLFFLVSSAFRTIETLHQVDGLTGLMRYYAFKNELDKKIHMRTGEQVVVVMYLDVHKFSDLNHTLGFEDADEILVGFARRLKSTYSANVILGRLGPDQFAVARLVNNIQEEIDDSISQLRYVFDTNARVLHQDLKCVIGVAIEPSDGRTAKLLMSAATTALNKAKSEQSAVQFYNKELSKLESARQSLLNDLCLALKNDQLSVVYQPQYRLGSQTFSGVEVLVRWRHPKLGFIPPDQFVELAEENNICDQISAFVIRRANKELKEYGLLDGKLERVSINISALEFNSTTLMNKLMKQIDKVPLLAQKMQIEITETAALDDLQKSVKVIETLKRQHIRFSVDDFGTGYTSLVILRDLPVDEVKIDRSFIGCLEHDKKSRAIVEAIITMTAGFDMSVVAEGVETQEQLDILSQFGCTEAQGYLLAMPMEIHKLAAHLTEMA